MIDQSEQDRVKTLLSEALPMLCRSGLNFASEFCVEALIGITLDKNDVILVSVKETIRNEEKSLEVSVTHQGDTPTKSNRKRKRTKRKHSDESDNESDSAYTDNDQSAVKREKMEGDDSESELESTTNSAYGQQNVKLEPSETDFSSYSFGDQGQQQHDTSGYPQLSAHPLASSSMLSPNNESLPGTSFAQPGQLIPNVGQQGSATGDDPSGTQGSMTADPLDAIRELGPCQWLCCYCQKLSKSKSDARKHIRGVHLKEKNHACRFCGRKFGERGNANQHEKKCPMKTSV